LSRETVHDILFVVGDWGLEEERKVREDGAEFLVVDLHSGEELSEDDHVVHERGGEEGVLADVVGGDRVGTVHEDLGGVLVHGSLGVTDEGDVLDDDFVVDFVVVLWVENFVRSHGVVEDSSLGDFLGLEALVFLEVLTVVVTEMVVGDAGGDSDSGTDEEVAHDGFETGLSRFEIGAGNETTVVSSVLDDGWVEGVLWRAVEVDALLLDGGNAVQHGGGELVVVGNSLLEVIDGVDLWEEEHLGVGGPQDDDLVGLGLHGLDVFSQDVDLLLVGSGEDVVCSVALVSGDEVWVEGGLAWCDLLHLFFKLSEQSWLEYFGAFGGFVQIKV